MKYIGVPTCPYCRKRVNIIRVWSMKKHGEFNCPRCKGISNIFLSPLIYVFAVIAISAAFLIYFFQKFIMDTLALSTTLYVFLPFAAFFFVSLFLVYLEKPVIKRVRKTKDGRYFDQNGNELKMRMGKLVAAGTGAAYATQKEAPVQTQLYEDDFTGEPSAPAKQRTDTFPMLSEEPTILPDLSMQQSMQNVPRREVKASVPIPPPSSVAAPVPAPKRVMQSRRSAAAARPMEDTLPGIELKSTVKREDDALFSAFANQSTMEINRLRRESIPDNNDLYAKTAEKLGRNYTQEIPLESIARPKVAQPLRPERPVEQTPIIPQNKTGFSVGTIAEERNTGKPSKSGFEDLFEEYTRNEQQKETNRKTENPSGQKGGGFRQL